MTLREAAIHGMPLNDWLVIDVHGHLGHPGVFDVSVTDAEGVLAIMDRVGIKTLCASHLLALHGDHHRGNDLMAEAASRYPGRFFAYAVVNPNLPDEIEPELDRCVNKLGMRGIKTHIAFHDHPSDSPAYWRVYEFAAQHKLPVLTHSMGSATQAAHIAGSFPGVNFIIAHSGGAYHGRHGDDIIDLAARHPNIFLDLASSLTYFGGLEVLVRRVGAEKILYGSDICYQQATHQIGVVLFADILEAQKELILGRNAARLFQSHAIV